MTSKKYIASRKCAKKPPRTSPKTIQSTQCYQEICLSTLRLSDRIVITILGLGLSEHRAFCGNFGCERNSWPSIKTIKAAFGVDMQYAKVMVRDESDYETFAWTCGAVVDTENHSQFSRLSSDGANLKDS